VEEVGEVVAVAKAAWPACAKISGARLVTAAVYKLYRRGGSDALSA
jgi:hypothetical protein